MTKVSRVKNSTRSVLCENASGCNDPEWYPVGIAVCEMMQDCELELDDRVVQFVGLKVDGGRFGRRRRVKEKTKYKYMRRLENFFSADVEVLRGVELLKC